MESIEKLKIRIESAIPGAIIETISNGSPSNQTSLLIDREHGRAVAKFLRDDPELQFDYASNATGVDWPEKATKEKVKVKKVVDCIEQQAEEIIEKKTQPYLEAVYHLFSIARRDGPLVIRMRTGDREKNVALPSLTPIWRSCELQEREIFDLFGIVFEGHPDLRRLLMWDEFADFPLRKDYAAPSDEGVQEGAV